MKATTKTKWENFKLSLIQLFGGLLMERDENDGTFRVSLGRAAFWALFIPAIIIWVKGGGKLVNGMEIRDIPDNYMKTLIIVLGYNLGSKVANTIKAVMYKGGGADLPADISVPTSLPSNTGPDENLRGNPRQ